MLFQSTFTLTMLNWASIVVVSLVCHGVYCKPQDQHENEPELSISDLDDQNDVESGHVPEEVEILGKLHILGIH